MRANGETQPRGDEGSFFLSCLSPRLPSKTTPPNPTPLQSKRKKLLHQLPRHRNPLYILRSRPYLESSSSSRYLRIKPPYLFLRPGSCCCCEGDQARDEKHERRGRMSSTINKRQQARNERILQDLLKSVAGNDRCADCGTKNPGWSMHF